MAGLLYYVPGHTGQMMSGDACKLGLAHAFGHLKDEGLLCRGVYNKGPDEKDGGSGAGTVVAEPTFAGKVGVFSDRQTWRKVPGSDAYVGYYTDDPPKPADVARSQMLPGHRVELGDGQKWTVPIARGIAEHGDNMMIGCTLPTAMAIDDDGNWQEGAVVPKYAALWKLAEQWWDTVVTASAAVEGADVSDAGLIVELADQNDAALLVLSANYRLGKAEVVLLGLFTSDTYGELLGALIDMPTMLAWQKKTTAIAGSNSSDGSKGGIPATAPQ